MLVNAEIILYLSLDLIYMYFTAEESRLKYTSSDADDSVLAECIDVEQSIRFQKFVPTGY